MNDSADTKPRTPVSLKLLRGLVALVGLAVLGLAGFVAYAYASTPPAIRQPKSDHVHVRLQVVVGGKDVDFGAEKFQTEYDKDVCTAAITKQPFHFHDGLAQFVHIHWAGMTGGLLLKNYGWNLVGGPSGALGYRTDDLPRLVRVPIHGDDLPPRPVGSHFYIYTGDKSGFVQRNWDQFVSQDLETFFAGTQPAKASLWDLFVDRAYAHGDDMPAASAKTEEERVRINHVIGNAVIFVQKDAPTQTQVKDKFDHLIELPDSVCGG